MAEKQALFVGINTFANCAQLPLNGCVNDARDMGAIYKEFLGFKASEMTTLTDAQATRANIMSNLTAMVAGAKAGMFSCLVFALSSHGTQMDDASGDEPDGKDEAFVPHDIRAPRHCREVRQVGSCPHHRGLDLVRTLAAVPAEAHNARDRPTRSRQARRARAGACGAAPSARKNAGSGNVAGKEWSGEEDAP